MIPTDRVSLEAIPEESQPVEALVQEAFQQRPELEQAVLTLKNDEITLRGARNALLPTLDVYGFYGASATGGAQSPNCYNFLSSPAAACPPNTYPTVSYGTTLSNLVNSSSPDKGAGFNSEINLRNREAQSVQERSLMEYRQAELRLEQLHTEIRMQVVNAMYALANDRAQVRAAVAARDYALQSMDAEQKKLHLGASTTANVLLQQRSLAIAEDNLIAAHAAYAKDRAESLPDVGIDVAALQHQLDGSCDRDRDDDACRAGSGSGAGRGMSRRWRLRQRRSSRRRHRRSKRDSKQQTAVAGWQIS